MDLEEIMRQQSFAVAVQKAVETARRMLDKAVALETVAWCTGLPLERVERLRQEAAAEA